MKKTVGVLAHVDAGKTTFSEQILYYGKGIETRGRVDHEDAFLDDHSIEKDRGITVFSGQGTFEYKASTYYLIDTPGHLDFSSEMERSIKIMDYAIIIVSGVDGVQDHTETVWQLLKKHRIPTFFFVNKMDREGANLKSVLEEIHSDLTPDSYYIEESFSEKKISEELIEFIAERDEVLLEKYIEEEKDNDLWFHSLKDMIKRNKVFPCFSGSALQDIGVDNFLDVFHQLTYTDYDKSTAEFSGSIYKIGHEKQGTKITYIKALSGKLKIRDEISYGVKDSRNYEKISEIRKYNGSSFILVDEVSAGDVFGVIGLNEAKVGQGVGAVEESLDYDIRPSLKSKVILDKNLNTREVLESLKILEAEDPALNIIWDTVLKEIHVHIMGVIQLEILKKLVLERFNIDIDFGPYQILYKETIEKEVVGYGHFEPLGHYAEVHLKMEAGERSSGIIFKSECHTDHLSIGQQNLIGRHIHESAHKGILTGSPITDIEITLLIGRGSNQHTKGGDFREATFRALRQGLEKAHSKLLEPYYSFKIQVDLDYMGRVISDIQKLNGSFIEPNIIGDKVVIEGRGPVAKFMDYPIELISFTEGRGKIHLNIEGYDICHNEDEIINKINYNKDADSEYTSNSIFFTNGVGYIVKARDVKDHMHCL